ncbi:SDR family NAD(P)-dependent oxidoreductase [Streptomyces umbrinus]|uniref:SDR family NAD(P)-dependent oxidoreductase n=1 Tax=Streptomyces umbrinus TaxID=67370 RepID=UPI0033E6418C
MTTSIVTGGGRGIGRATALALADAGHAVAVLARSRPQIDETVQLIQRAGGTALAIPVDVADPASVTEAVRVSEQSLGRCDVLVNIAAVNGPIALTGDIEPTAWDELFRINLTGTFLMCQAVLPAMIEAGHGRILNTISGLASRVQPGLAAYSASKAAVAHFSAVLAAEYAEQGISAFAVNPGIVKTALLNELIGLPNADAAQNHVTSRMHSDTVRDMMLQPEESAALYRRIAAGELDDRNGQVVSVYDESLNTA